MTKYTEDPDKFRIPCPVEGCPFVATGRNAQRDLNSHLRGVHERSS